MAYRSRTSRHASGSYSVGSTPMQQVYKLSPMGELDLMIQMGWGDTPQQKLPKDWRTRQKPLFKKSGKKAAQE